MFIRVYINIYICNLKDVLIFTYILCSDINMSRKGLNEEQLIELLNWDLSDDDLDCSDSEDDMGKFI